MHLDLACADISDLAFLQKIVGTNRMTLEISKKVHFRSACFDDWTSSSRRLFSARNSFSRWARAVGCLLALPVGLTLEEFVQVDKRRYH